MSCWRLSEGSRFVLEGLSMCESLLEWEILFALLSGFGLLLGLVTLAVLLRLLLGCRCDRYTCSIYGLKFFFEGSLIYPLPFIRLCWPLFPSSLEAVSFAAVGSSDCLPVFLDMSLPRAGG